MLATSASADSRRVWVLLASASLLASAYLLERPTATFATAWVIACALVLATHYYGALIVAPEAVWLVWVHRRRRPVVVAVAIVAVCGLALIPLAISQNGTGHASWIAHAALSRRLISYG